MRSGASKNLNECLENEGNLLFSSIPMSYWHLLLCVWTVDPWTTWVWTVQVCLYMYSFSIKNYNTIVSNVAGISELWIWRAKWKDTLEYTLSTVRKWFFQPPHYLRVSCKIFKIHALKKQDKPFLIWQCCTYIDYFFEIFKVTFYLNILYWVYIINSTIKNINIMK